MLYYLGTADIPGKMANSIQQMRMCDAFVRAGEEVVYLHGHVVGERGTVTWDDVAAFYGLEERFTIKTFRNFYGKTGRFTKIGTVSMALPMALYVFLHVLSGRLGKDDVVYGRNYYPMYFLTELLKVVPDRRRPPVVFEFHNPIDMRFKQRFFSQVDGVVSITERLADYTAETYDIDRERIFVAPDGVDLEPYEGLSQREAREELGLPHEADIVMYTGHCYEGKGVETLVEAATELDALVYVVGGYEKDIERVKSAVGHPENVVFTGFVEPAEIPEYQVAADVLVAPYTDESRAWVSPLKLFEYMAAGRPIVASDRAVLQEVLTDGENALLFEQNDSNSLLSVVQEVLESEQQSLVDAADSTVREYTWDSRAQSILDYY